MCQNISQIHENWNPELNKKWCLKTYPNKSKNAQKMIPKSLPKNEGISEVAPLGAPLVAYTACGHQKWAPGNPKVLPMFDK